MPIAKEMANTRREFLRMAGAAAGCMALPMWMTTPVAGQNLATPEAALAELMAGNQRYVSGKLKGQESVAAQRQKTAAKQEPFAAVLSCFDSRVPVEEVFDQGLGQIAVARVAGNVVTPEIIGSLEFGTVALGAKVVMVLGHSGCGAVKAAIAAKEVPGQISSLFPHLQAAVNEANGDVEAGGKANARLQAKLLQQSSTVIAGLVEARKVKVVAGYYDLASGVVSLV